MKRMLTLAAILTVIVGASAFVLQRIDLAGAVDEEATLYPINRANTAATGTWIDLAKYASAAVVVVMGHADDAAGLATQDWVIQDSFPALAVRTLDSLQTDTIDGSVGEYNYKGNGRYLRVLMRATGNAADTVVASAIVLLGNKRHR